MRRICSVQENKHIYYVDADLLGALRHIIYKRNVILTLLLQCVNM